MGFYNMGWTTPPSQFAVNVRESIEPTQKRVAVDLTRNLVLNTPVDTGRARANWIVTVGKPSNRTLQITDKTGSKTVAKAEKINIPAEGDLIFISNNLPYIVYLDKGTDKMAPFNIVQRSLKAVANRVGWDI